MPNIHLMTWKWRDWRKNWVDSRLRQVRKESSFWTLSGFGFTEKDVKKKVSLPSSESVAPAPPNGYIHLLLGTPSSAAYSAVVTMQAAARLTELKAFIKSGSIASISFLHTSGFSEAWTNSHGKQIILFLVVTWAIDSGVSTLLWKFQEYGLVTATWLNRE